MRGKFIVFEGIDFSGKSTQSKLLRDRLISEEYDVLLTREPGEASIPACASMRNMLTNRKEYKVDPRTAILLMVADRACHVENMIKKALEEGKVVISDRYYYSTLAYQVDEVFDFRTLLDLNQKAINGIEPDEIFYIDIPNHMLEKRRNSGRVIEQNDDLPLDRFQQIRDRYDQAFLHVINHKSSVVSYVYDNGSKTKEEISEKIYKKVKNLINKQKNPAI